MRKNCLLSYALNLAAILGINACAPTSKAPAVATAGQPAIAIRQLIQEKEVEQHIRFLASDELKGRDTGSDELRLAARYLAEHFRSWKTKSLPNLQGYLQEVPFQEVKPHTGGTLTLAEQTFSYQLDFIARAGGNGNWSGKYIYLPYATPEEVKKANVAEKWVITHAGNAALANPQAQYYGTLSKQKTLIAAGALGLIEVYEDSQLPWQQITGYLRGGHLELSEQEPSEEVESFVTVWLKPQTEAWWTSVENSSEKSFSLKLQGKQEARIFSPNVLAVIPGTDPILKNEYVVLSAHYDHVGIGQAVAGDSIYNGARDNAVGTTAVLMAGKYFAQHPAKRSILLACWTAEEKGLLGSQYFIEHNPIPLKQLVFNLNIDGAGYNDTTKVTVIGLERTSAEADILAGSQIYGLTAIPDPVPEQNLFDRSDNVHFAKAGIPAPTYSMGLTAFDAEVGKYYHQAADEAESLNFRYVTQYIRGFTGVAERIANTEQAPFWVAGDKYEEAGKILYQK